MKCQNCGAKVRKWDTYCPKCGMELFSSEYKPLKNKYLRGEYHEQREGQIEPYDLEGEDNSAAEYYEDNYQNQDDYQNKEKNQHNPDENSQFDQDKNYNQGQNKSYKKKYNGNRNYQQNYNPKGYQKKKYRGYDLDEYYESEETGSSIWGTVFLLLIVALLFGFVMGFMFFSTKI